MNNEMIATEVMGWHKDTERGISLWWFMGDCSLSETADATTSLPDFLNDHNAAMMVVEKMSDSGYCLDMGFNKEWSEAVFYKGYDGDGQKIDSNHAHADTLCSAICEAALKAKGIQP